MTTKSRRPLDRCDFCQKRVHHTDCVLKKGVDPVLGWISIAGIAHKSCAEANATPVKQ